MTLLLCPECCQWREPIEGRCPVCAGTLDLAVPDPSLEALADEIGDLQGLLGEADLSRNVLPKRGRLYATTNGLLLVPNESRVIVFAVPQSSPLALPGRGIGDERQRADDVGGGSPLTPNPSLRRGEWDKTWGCRWLSRLWSRLKVRGRTIRFACERRLSENLSRDRIALAELLRCDPGVVFWSRGTIATWRRHRGQWDLIRPDSHSWPERIAMRDRDGDRALQTWLETTECPLPVNVC